MIKPKAMMVIGLLTVIAISIWMAITSNPISGVSVFFILTVLLWAIAKSRHWI